MTRIAVPALIAMLTVAGYVAAAGWNGSGEPRLIITLTERELPMVELPRSDEDPGLQLQFAYERRYDPLDARNWLTEQRLREIGFALYVPVGSPQAVDAYDHVPARLAWVVFEYDGPLWREIERRRAVTETEAGPARIPPLTSRLVPVDAGVDFDALRVRYPSGHLILRAEIGLSYVTTEGGGRVLRGTLRDVVPRRVAVPTRMRAVVDARGARAGEPRYEVDLALGTLGLPYVRALRARGEN
jgi:hypothetical protein